MRIHVRDGLRRRMRSRSAAAGSGCVGTWGRGRSRRAMLCEAARCEQHAVELAFPCAEQVERPLALEPGIAAEEEPRLRPRVVLPERLQDFGEAGQVLAGVRELPREVEVAPLRNLDRQELR